MNSILACACRCALRVSVGSLLFFPLACKPLFFAGLSEARGESETVEVRSYQILVDGDRCGKCRMSIESRPDGRHVVLGDSSLELKYLLYTFRFSSQGNETWHGGKLEKLENAASYGNSRYQVSATGDGDELVVRADGQERKLPRNVWTTSYWLAPEDELLGQTISLLDSHKGRTLSAKLQRVGEESIALGDRAKPCSHYRLRGDVEVDLWYDAAGRLVRKEAIESGHRTRLQLVAIKPAAVVDARECPRPCPVDLRCLGDAACRGELCWRGDQRRSEPAALPVRAAPGGAASMPGVQTAVGASPS